MIKGLVLTMLTLETWSDIRSKTVSGIRIIIFIVVGIILNIILKYQSVLSVVTGAFLGGILLIYAVITKGGVGMGDGLMFICLGIYLGLSCNLKLLFGSLIVAAIVGGVTAIVRRRNIKSQIPFMPCVLCTYIIILFMEAIV